MTKYYPKSSEIFPIITHGEGEGQQKRKKKKKKRVHLNIRPIIYKLAPGCPSKEGEWTLGCHTVDFPHDPSLLFLSPKGKGEKKEEKKNI